MKKVFIKIRRYILFLFEYLYESIRGLDFTLPVASDMIIHSDVYNGYCKTPEKHMRTILENLHINCAESSFIDVGSGKGAVLRVAKKFGFRRVVGLELDEKLVRTARRNMMILKYTDVECICGNALEFERYDEFDVFFLFNPFTSEILEQVLEKIMGTLEKRPRSIRIIYHHPVHYQVMEKAGLARTAVLHDKLKDYDTYIYSFQ